MNVRVFQTQEVQELLKAAANLEGKDGNVCLLYTSDAADECCGV